MGENFKLKRFLPFFILVTMAFLAGGTSFFSETIQSQVVEVLKGYLVLAKPMVSNIYIGLVALSLLYALALP